MSVLIINLTMESNDRSHSEAPFSLIERPKTIRWKKKSVLSLSCAHISFKNVIVVRYRRKMSSSTLQPSTALLTQTNRSWEWYLWTRMYPLLTKTDPWELNPDEDPRL